MARFGWRCSGWHGVLDMGLVVQLLDANLGGLQVMFLRQVIGRLLLLLLLHQFACLQ